MNFLSYLKPQQLFILKYGLLIVNLFLMIMTIRTYVNYITIVQSIDDTRQEIKLLDQKISYIQYIEKPYLQSSRALTFLAHESNKRMPGEKLIQLIPTNTGSGGGILSGGLGYSGSRLPVTQRLSETTSYSSPQEARSAYFQSLSW